MLQFAVANAPTASWVGSHQPRPRCLYAALPCSAQAGDAQVLADAVRVGQYGQGEAPASVDELASRLLTSVYMGTENSRRVLFFWRGSAWAVVAPVCVW